MLDWDEKAERLEHRPSPVNKIPEVFHQLGSVFFPIPRRKKGYSYPHHLDEYRHSAGDEILNAYFEAGWGYGIACAGNLSVVDIDDKRFASRITDALPETTYQITGSRTGYHLFYRVDGLDTRINLHHPVAKHVCDRHGNCTYDDDGECVQKYVWDHLGEVKCDPHGYVVGPGSVHPSGNKYELVEDNGITSITEDELRVALSPFIKEEIEEKVVTSTYSNKDSYDEDRDNRSTHPFYELSADDVIPGLSRGERMAHPVHGSSSGINFMKNEDGETFTCWRCQYGKGDGCGLSSTQFLACAATNERDCSRVRKYWSRDSTLHYQAWKEAVDRGLVTYNDIPHKVVKGYAVLNGVSKEDDYLDERLVHELKQQMKSRYEAEQHLKYIEKTKGTHL